MIRHCIRDLRVIDVPPSVSRDIVLAVRMEHRRDERDRTTYLRLVTSLRRSLTMLKVRQ